MIAVLSPATSSCRFIAAQPNGPSPASAGKLPSPGPRICAAIALVLAGLSPLPTLAQTPDPIAAALEACSDVDDSLNERLTLLADAGWQTAGDSRLVRELVAQRIAMRNPQIFDARVESGIAKLQDAVSVALPLTQSPGQTLGLALVTDQLAKAPNIDAILAHPDHPSIIELRIGGMADSIAVNCNIGFGAPLSTDQRATLLHRLDQHEGLGLLEQIDAPAYDGAPKLLFFTPRPLPPNGHSRRLVVLDIQPTSPFYGKMADAGIQTPLATSLDTNFGPIPVR